MTTAYGLGLSMSAELAFNLGAQSAIDGGSAGGYPAGAFVSSWKTDNFTVGSSGDTRAKIPTVSSGTYNCVVNWGDGTTSTITTYNNAAWTHTYSVAGTYTIIITGTFTGFAFDFGGDRNKLLNIFQWGCFKFGNTGGYFYACENLRITATDAPDLTGTTTFRDAFRWCYHIPTIPGIGNWDVSAITDMSSMFAFDDSFNDDISGWNTGNVTTMANMFYNAAIFNQNIGGWNVSKVTDMQHMFDAALVFNQNLNSWNVSLVTNMDGMFNNARAFNGNISSWVTSAVTNMSGMFQNAYAFNQDISGWNTGNVVYFRAMFRSAFSFNQNIGGWNTGSGVEFEYMFQAAGSFNQNLGAWNVTSLADATLMFSGLALSTANYDALLTGWGNQALQSGVTFDGSSSQYTGLSAAAGARDHMTNGFGWTITDGGAINTPTGITFWVDGSNTSTITKAYQNMTETGSGTSGTKTITASATVANRVQPGMKIRIGGTDIYTVSSIVTTTIRTVETLTSTYGAGSALALDRLSQWNDLSGNTNNATQATASKQPIYTPARLNTNMATITGDAVSTLALPSGVYGIPNGDNTVVCLSNRTLHDAFERRTIAMTKTSSQRYQLAYTATRDQVSFTNSVSPVTKINPPEDAFQVVIGTRSGTTQSIQVDAGASALNSSGVSEPAIDSAAIFSNGIGTSAFFVGNIAELIVFNRALSGTEITQVLAYLAAKWQYNVPPSNVLTAGGQSVIGQYGYFITAS